MKRKIKLIFAPFLFISFGFISLYTFFNWLLFIKLDLFPIGENIINFGLPMLLLWLPLLIWLRPKINLLEWRQKNRKFAYTIAAWFLIACPTMIAQKYMTTATGKLTELTNINDIAYKEKTKFYTVKNYFVFKDPESYVSAEMSGRYNEHMHWNIYVAFPIYESIRANIKRPSAWLGIKYFKEIDNRLSEEEKKSKFEDFIKNCEKDINEKDLQEFVYLNRIPRSYHLDGYLQAIKESPKLTKDNAIILSPINEPFAQRNGTMPFWLCVSFFLGAFVWLAMLWKPQLNKENHTCKAFTEDLELRQFLSYFIPKKDYFVTPILLNLNIFIFLMMFFSGAGFMSFKSNDLINWGANYTPHIINGHYWRLLSSIFLHGGIIHLACNMPALVFIGICLESALGKSMFTITYLITGVIASLASIYWNSYIIGVGSSGAILGLYGVFLAILIPKTLPSEVRDPLLGVVAIFIFSSLIMGFITPGIDNAAHLSGFASGFALGLLINKDKKITFNLIKAN